MKAQWSRLNVAKHEVHLVVVIYVHISSEHDFEGQTSHSKCSFRV